MTNWRRNCVRNGRTRGESNATMAAANHVEDWNVSGSVKEEISETVE